MNSSQLSVIQISALGANADAVSEYHLNKKAADDCLKQLDVAWVIIKPSLVYGPGGKSAALFKAISALPLVPLVDAALGIATLARYRTQRIGLIQISLILVYSILISMGPSELWLHPFGPVTKNIPLMVI